MQTKGDQAISKYASFFDNVNLQDSGSYCSRNIFSKKRDFYRIERSHSIGQIQYLQLHEAQKTEKIEIETTIGVTCWQEKRAIQKVGLYIPGGTAPLFSTVLMLAIPAKIAGCKEIVMCTPPDRKRKY